MDGARHRDRRLTGVLAALLLIAALAIVLMPAGDDDGVLAPVANPEGAPAADRDGLEATRRPSGTDEPDRETPTESGPRTDPALTLPSAPDPAPGRAALQGTVLAADGAPARDADVAVFALEGDRPASRAAALVSTSSDGAFAIPLDDLPEQAMVIVAARPGERPAYRFLAGRDEVLHDAVALRMETGLVIAGRLTRNGRAEPEVRLSLDATPGVAGHFFSFIPLDHGRTTEVIWREGRPETKHAHATTADDGTYAFRGLGPGPHVVHVGPFERQAMEEAIRPLVGPDEPLRIVTIEGQRVLTFEAPDARADIPFETAWVLLETPGPSAGSARRRRAELVLAEEGKEARASTSFDLGEHIVLEVVAGRRHEVVVSGHAFATFEGVLPALEPGETATLEVALTTEPHLEIELVLPRDVAETARFVSLELHELQDTAPLEGLPALDPRSRWRIPRRDDGFVLIAPRLEAGHYRLVAEIENTTYLPIVRDVSLPAAGRVVIELAGKEGARLETLLGWPRRPGGYEIAVILRDASGATVRRETHSLSILPGSGSGRGNTHELRQPVFPPGSYRLEFLVNGRTLVDESIALRAGQVFEKILEVDPVEPSAR